jgi:CubicO group peptidase (beta-lactamase class C family)
MMVPREPLEDALERLRERAIASQSTAFVAERGGAIVAETGETERSVEIMSITKSVVSLVVGQLVDRKLLSLEASAADFLPSWRGTPKEKIRVVHLLEHTTGLVDKPTTEDIYAAGDFVAFALSAEVERAPGTRYRYNNRASNLLPEIFARASGVTIDAWAREHLFEPLGITDVTWAKDRAGNVQGMSGLCMSARSLVRLGRLVLDGGTWGGHEIVSRAWLDASTRTYRDAGSFWSAAPRGLSWWLDPSSTEIGLSSRVFESWAGSGVPADFIARLRPLEGRFFPSHGEFREAVQSTLLGKVLPVSDRRLAPFYAMTWKANRPDGETRYGAPRSISANGWGGQYLIALPSLDLVIVRLRAVEEDERGNFFEEVNALLLGVERPRISPALRSVRVLLKVLGPLLRKRR